MFVPLINLLSKSNLSFLFLFNYLNTYFHYSSADLHTILSAQRVTTQIRDLPLRSNMMVEDKELQKHNVIHRKQLKSKMKY